MKREGTTMVNPPSEGRPSGEGPPRPAPPKPPAAGGGSPLRIYRPGQGTAVRWGTAAGAGVIVLAFGNFLFNRLAFFGVEVQTIVPVIAVVALAGVVFWLVGQYRKFVNFLIDTESEMRKVNWSSRKDVLGHTKVVIFTVLAMGFMLFVVDVVSMGLFSWAGVLRVGFWERFFGGAE